MLCICMFPFFVWEENAFTPGLSAYMVMEIFQCGGVVQKNFEGDVGGIQMFEVLSEREIFFCFVSKFFKIKSGIYKFGQGRD